MPARGHSKVMRLRAEVALLARCQCIYDVGLSGVNAGDFTACLDAAMFEVRMLEHPAVQEKRKG